MISFLGLLLMFSLTFAAVADTASPYIAPEAARAAALKHAGVAETDATIVRVKLDRDKDGVQYEVEFYSGGKEYDYDIDAVSGQVVGFDSEMDTLPLPVQQAEGLISAQAAQEAALAHAKADGAAATLMLTQLGLDDGRWEYEIEFYIGSTEYDYEIDALTGEVLSFDQDMESVAPTAVTATGDIGAEKAKEIALAHAGLTAEKVRGLEAELDRDGRTLLYEVDFKADGKEYSYDIDAATGSILKSEVEKDD